MMKKLVAALLCMALILSAMAACGGEANSPSSSEGESSAAGASTDSGEMDKTPITFTVFAKDPNAQYEDFESPVAQKITEATGVTLQMEYPVGDIKEKVGIMLASGEYPDMMFLGGEMGPFVEAGALVDMTEMIENSKNISKMVEGYTNRLKYSMEDQAIYALPGYGAFDAKWEPSQGTWIAHQAVIDAGYPEIKTLADVEKIIADYVAANPTVDGQPTIGLSFATDDWRWQSSVGNASGAVTGLAADGNWYIDPETYEATYRFALDSHREYYRWLNHMNDIGLLDPEAFTQKYDQYSAKIASGRVVALQDEGWQIREGQNALRAAGKENLMHGIYPAQLDDTTVSGDFIDKGYVAGMGMSISTSCKDIDRAFAFLDWMASDEGQILNNWGIEGENYVIEDGLRVIPEEEWAKRTTDPEYSKKTGVGVYLYPFPAWGKGVLDASGQSYNTATTESITNNYTKTEKEILAKYDAEMWRDLYPTAEELGRTDPWGYAWQMTIPDTSDVPVIVTKLLDLTKKYIAQSVTAAPEAFDGIWDEFQTEMANAGLEEATAEYTKLIKERIELWS